MATLNDLDQKDAEVLASILAGVATSRRKLAAGEGWVTSRTSDVEPQYVGTCCAVGAGALYAGIDREQLQFNVHGTIGAFADKYDVSLAYACGVSDGFETNDLGFIQASIGSHEYRKEPDYHRGYAVGAAVRASTCEVESLEEAKRS